jgi:hypothetical protein
MVLPLCECPAAPGQGVLAIECRARDSTTRRILSALHDDVTAKLVDEELAAVDAAPPPDRVAAGATSVHVDALGPVTFFSRPGSDPTLRWRKPPRPAIAVPWDGQRLTKNRPATPLHIRAEDLRAECLFVAHWRAVTASLRIDAGTRIWVSGVRSWRELARRGLLVEGCADNLGFRQIVATLSSGVLELAPLAKWAALTSQEAAPGWRDSGIGSVIASYRLGNDEDIAMARGLDEEISRATHFYWGSVHQYRAASAWLPPNAQHSCGPGKTADSLRRLGVQPLASFPSREAWREWLA